MSGNKRMVTLKRYLVFYDIHGEIASAEIIAKNSLSMKRRFKNIYGGWKITHFQKLNQ